MGKMTAKQGKKNPAHGKVIQQKLLEKICAVYVAIMIPVHLLAVPVQGYGEISQMKHQIFLCGTIGLVMTVIVLRAENILLNGRLDIKRPTYIDPWIMAMLLYGVATGISALLSPYSGIWYGNGRMDGALTVFLYLMLALILSCYLQPKKWMLWLFGGGITVTCGIGFLQFMGYNPLGLYPSGYSYYDAGRYYSGAFWGTIGNVDLAASILCAAVGVFFVYLIQSKQMLWYCMIPLVVSAFSIAELDVKAAYVTLVLGLPLLFPVLSKDKMSVRRYCSACSAVLLGVAVSEMLVFSETGVFMRLNAKTAILVVAIFGVSAFGRIVPHVLSMNAVRRIFCCGLLGGAMACIAMIRAYDGFERGFLFEIHQILRGNWQDTFGSGRIFIWKQSFEKFLELPWFGGGPDTLGLRDLQGFSRYSDELGFTVYSSIDAAHNEYLNILVNQGIFAFITYGVILWLTIRKAWREEERIAILAGGGAVVLYCIQAFFGISMSTNSMYLWFGIGLVNSRKCVRPLETKRRDLFHPALLKDLLHNRSGQGRGGGATLS